MKPAAQGSTQDVISSHWGQIVRLVKEHSPIQPGC